MIGYSLDSELSPKTKDEDYCIDCGYLMDKKYLNKENICNECEKEFEFYTNLMNKESIERDNYD